MRILRRLLNIIAVIILAVLFFSSVGATAIFKEIEASKEIGISDECKVLEAVNNELSDGFKDISDIMEKRKALLSCYYECRDYGEWR